MYVKLDRDYEVKTTLGTIKEIEKLFGKSFFEVVNSLSSMRIEYQIKLLFVGVKKADPEVDEKSFIATCEEHLGVGELMEYLEQYFYAMQYPGLSSEEVQEKIQKKLHQKQNLEQNLNLTGRK